MQYQNPILPGFYPDPSVCRVGQDYYLANSTFEYFPGMPIHHSTDLLNWRLVGHALNAGNAFDLSGANAFGGIWAPTIRFHQGKFYLICTNVKGKGNFVVTATDPAGPWSQPFWFEEKGFDPSIFFDDDGKVYLSMHQDGEKGRLMQADFDPVACKTLGPWREIWRGTGGIWPEGPHLYKKNGYYYLMIAEGGTRYTHSIAMARSRQPYGPYEPCPRNPLLTQFTRPGHPIQCTGHGDLVEAADGSWWLVYLGVRPVDKEWHHLGRETYLAPVTWETDGWPKVHPPELSLPAASWMGSQAGPQTWHADFNAKELDGAWNFVRNPDPSHYRLGERPGCLRLLGDTARLEQPSVSPTWAGIRQRHFNVTFAASLDFKPSAAGHHAGVSVRMNEGFAYIVELRGGEAVLVERLAGKARDIASQKLAAGEVVIQVQADPRQYSFSVIQGAAILPLGKLDCKELSTEKAEGFTGVYFGVFCEGEGAIADLSKVSYLPAAV